MCTVQFIQMYFPSVSKDVTDLKNDNIVSSAVVFVSFSRLKPGHLRLKNRTVPNSKSRNIPEVVIVRRGAVGVLGIGEGRPVG